MIKTVKVFEAGSAISDVILENTAQNVVWGEDCADLGVIMPCYIGDVSGEYVMLLAPQKTIFCEAKKVITYGMAPNNDITLSSVGEERCVMTVQKEICDLWGNIIEPQDIVISRMHLEPASAMAVAAALLITGADRKLWVI